MPRLTCRLRLPQRREVLSDSFPGEMTGGDQLLDSWLRS